MLLKRKAGACNFLSLSLSLKENGKEIREYDANERLYESCLYICVCIIKYCCVKNVPDRRRTFFFGLPYRLSGGATLYVPILEHGCTCAPSCTGCHPPWHWSSGNLYQRAAAGCSSAVEAFGKRCSMDAICSLMRICNTAPFSLPASKIVSLWSFCKQFRRCLCLPCTAARSCAIEQCGTSWPGEKKIPTWWWGKDGVWKAEERELHEPFLILVT